MNHEHIQQRGMSIRKTIIAVLVFYLATFALNIVAIHESIERQTYGTSRTFWLSLTTHVAPIARTLRLDQPRLFINRTIGAVIND